MKYILLLELTHNLMEGSYRNPQNYCVESHRGKAKGKIKRMENKFLEVIAWADACDKERLVQKGQIIESLFLQNC